MATLCKTYSTPDAARQAVDDLIVAGVPADGHAGTADDRVARDLLARPA
jgi:hypothetical protein